MHVHASCIANGAKLIVDGTEYACTDFYSVWEDPDEVAGVYFVFPPIDKEGASSILFVYEDTTIVVK